MFGDKYGYGGSKLPIVLVTAVVTAVLCFFVSAALIVTLKIGSWFDYSIKFSRQNVSFENVDKFNKVKEILGEDYYKKVDENQMIEGAIAGMADALKDPYTVYYTKEQMKAFTEQTEGSYVGIGVSINLDDNGLLSIVEPFEDSPAKKAGILKGDKIIKVDEKDVTTIRDEEIIIKMIKGKENTKVKITVYRPSEEKSIDFMVTRKKIKITNIKSEVLSDNIGYIKIVMFDDEISNYFEQHLNKLIAKGIKGLIIDVRDNPGGDYNEVVKIADRLLPKGIVVYTQDRKGRKSIEESDSIELEMPIAILVNGHSASASEVLAGAVKDHKKGILVGTKTYGKGLVQSVVTLGDGSGLKFTIARYFTPSDVCIQGIGIQPDENIPIGEKYNDVPVSQIPAEDDVQLKRAVEIISNKIR